MGQPLGRAVSGHDSMAVILAGSSLAHPRIGTVEEWTIANATTMDHPFHLHVWPMQVISAPDVRQSRGPDWRDVVVVPANGEVRVRIAFADHGGRTVYHCHILDHEDRGMMAVVNTSA